MAIFSLLEPSFHTFNLLLCWYTSCFETEASLALGTRPSKAGRFRAHTGSTEFKIMLCFLTKLQGGKETLGSPGKRTLQVTPPDIHSHHSRKKSSSNRKETEMRNSELKSLRSLPSNSCCFTYLSFSHT